MFSKLYRWRRRLVWAAVEIKVSSVLLRFCSAFIPFPSSPLLSLSLSHSACVSHMADHIFCMHSAHSRSSFVLLFDFLSQTLARQEKARFLGLCHNDLYCLSLSLILSPSLYKYIDTYPAYIYMSFAVSHVLYALRQTMRKRHFLKGWRVLLPYQQTHMPVARPFLLCRVGDKPPLDNTVNAEVRGL